jgi:hypothetical protein
MAANSPASDTLLDGLNEYFTNDIEPAIRTPQDSEFGPGRADRLAWGTLVVVALGVVCLVLGLPIWLYAPVLVAGAGLGLTALQLRMGGAGLSAMAIRDLIVARLAKFLACDYERDPESDRVEELFGAAGPISMTSIALRIDLLSGKEGGVTFHSVQIIGAVGPTRPNSLWLGVPVDQLTKRYTVDGLLMRFRLEASTGFCLTVSNDRRLGLRDKPESIIPELLTPATGHDGFDDDFRVLNKWHDDYRKLLTPPLCALLVQVGRDLGPLTAEVRNDEIWLNFWSVGDYYELTSLGSALASQTRRVASIMSMPRFIAGELHTHVLRTA